MDPHRTGRLVPAIGASLLVSGALLVACATGSAPRPPAATWSSELAPQAHVEPPPVTGATADPEVTASTQTVCELECERPSILPRTHDGPDHTARATENAAQVLEAMHGDLLACYRRRIDVYPQAHAFITVEIVVDSGGRVRTVDTTGGANLGEATMACIVHRIRRATFERPHGGGTLTIVAPFSFRRVGPGDDAL